MNNIYSEIIEIIKSEQKEMMLDIEMAHPEIYDLIEWGNITSGAIIRKINEATSKLEVNTKNEIEDLIISHQNSLTHRPQISNVISAVRNAHLEMMNASNYVFKDQDWIYAASIINNQKQNSGISHHKLISEIKKLELASKNQ